MVSPHPTSYLTGPIRSVVVASRRRPAPALSDRPHPVPSVRVDPEPGDDADLDVRLSWPDDQLLALPAPRRASSPPERARRGRKAAAGRAAGKKLDGRSESGPDQLQVDLERLNKSLEHLKKTLREVAGALDRRSEEEARLIEEMATLTKGVRSLRRSMSVGGGAAAVSLAPEQMQALVEAV